MSRGSPRRSSPEGGGRPRRALRRPQLFDVVRVRQALPELGIRRGDEGTIVEVLKVPEGYLVDFSYEPGYEAHALPVYGLTAEQIEVVQRHHATAAPPKATIRAR